MLLFASFAAAFALAIISTALDTIIDAFLSLMEITLSILICAANIELVAELKAREADDWTLVRASLSDTIVTDAEDSALARDMDSTLDAELAPALNAVLDISLHPDSGFWRGKRAGGWVMRLLAEVVVVDKIC